MLDIILLHTIIMTIYYNMSMRTEKNKYYINNKKKQSSHRTQEHERLLLRFGYRTVYARRRRPCARNKGKQ